jgi:CheY-like chemotaxis protein
VSEARVLVVDDHEPGRRLLLRILELDGYEATGVASVSAAARKIAELRPTLITLDVCLADGDGLELARRVKNDPHTAATTIVACTAAAMSNDRERALRSGCDAYVSKPIDPRAFSELVASLLPSCSRRRAPRRGVREECGA